MKLTNIKDMLRCLETDQALLGTETKVANLAV
jgi:hypothetical protein